VSNVELLVNDLSLHGQFQDLASFRDAIGRVMMIRQVAQRFGRALHCHRNMAHAQVTPTLLMQQAIQGLTLDERRVLITWLHQRGPFWEEARVHCSDEYLECNGNVVTDSAVGEAAYCCIHGIDRRLVSLAPSSWEFSPVAVTWMPDTGDERTVNVINHLEVDELEVALQAAPVPLASWGQLENICIARCSLMIFSGDAFEPLHGYPFVEGAAHRILVLLDTLNRFKSCFDGQGQRTPEGQRLYQDHFTGDKAWFSDSSDAEKRDFRTELTFWHPTANGERLFCPMHGKVKTPQLRIHFSWPVRADDPIFIVYVGPKITKQ
jgi:hypothetical protein